jgi:hypothetical protein
MKVMATKRWAACLSMALASVQVACDTHVDPLVEVHLATSIQGATEGPWAVCYAPGGGTDMPTVCPDPKPGGEERYCMASSVFELQEDGSTWCDVAAVCVYDCVVDDDCPQPQSGTVKPVCDSRCLLPCDQDSVCPHGMTCWHQYHGSGIHDQNGICMWKYECD